MTFFAHQWLNVTNSKEYLFSFTSNIKKNKDTTGRNKSWNSFIHTKLFLLSVHEILVHTRPLQSITFFLVCHSQVAHRDATINNIVVYQDKKHSL